MPTTLDELPVELLVSILQYLGGRDITRCCSVSRTIQTVVKGSTHFQYFIELEAAGMQDVPSNSTDVTTKLSLLRKHQHIMRNQTSPTFKFIEKIVAQYMRESWANFDFGGVAYIGQGIFSELAISSKNNRWRLLCWQLPRVLLQVPYSHWTIRFDVPAKAQYAGHTTDTCQGLLFILYGYSRTYNTRSDTFGLAFSLITGRPHDLASPMSEDIPIFESGPGDMRRTADLTVIGEYIFVITTKWDDPDDENNFYHGPMSGEQFSLVQFNWQTGRRELVANLQLPMDIVEGTTYFHKHRSAALLDKSHIAVCSTVEENDVDGMLVISIIDLERMRRGISLRNSTLILELPTPVDSKIIRSSWCNVWHDYLGPEGRWYPCPPGSPLKHPPFEYCNNHAILGFSWHYITDPDGPNGRGDDYKGYVPIFRLIEWSLGEKRTLKWEEWGACSRIFEGDFEIYGGTNYGSKAIIASWEDEHDERVVMNSKRWYEFVDFDTTFGGNDKHQLGNAAEYVTTPTEIIPIVPMTCGKKLVSGSLLPYRRYPLKLSPHPIDVGGQDPPTAATTGCSILVEHLQASGWSIYNLDYSADS